MKRFIISAVVVWLAFAESISAAAAVDWASMSDEEIIAEIDYAKTELKSREIALDPGNQVIARADGLIVRLKGNPAIRESYDGNKVLTVNVVAVNKGSEEVTLSIEDVYINGWKKDAFESITVAPGKKSREKLEFYDVDTEADLNDISELETLEFHSYTFDPKTYETLTREIIATAVFQQ